MPVGLLTRLFAVHLHLEVSAILQFNRSQTECILSLPPPHTSGPYFLGEPKSQKPWSHPRCLPLARAPPAGHPKTTDSASSLDLASSSHLFLFRFSPAVLEMFSGSPACSRLSPVCLKRRPDRAAHLEVLSLLSIPSNYVLLSEEQSAQDHHVLDFLPPPQPRRILQPPYPLAIHSCSPAPRRLSALHPRCLRSFCVQVFLDTASFRHSTTNSYQPCQK